MERMEPVWEGSENLKFLVCECLTMLVLSQELTALSFAGNQAAYHPFLVVFVSLCLPLCGKQQNLHVRDCSCLWLPILSSSHIFCIQGQFPKGNPHWVHLSDWKTCIQTDGTYFFLARHESKCSLLHCK